MADLFGFDARQVKPLSDFEPIPNGKYVAKIVASEMKRNKAETGSLLEIVFEIQEGPHANRLLWSRLNLDHPSQAAVEMARGELSAICRAVGVMAPRDSAELHDVPLVVHVKCRKRADTGEIVNEIRGYSSVALAASSSEPSPPPNVKLPWARSS